MYIIHIKALERNTVIIYDHLGLSGLERAGNFILFFEFFLFYQTLFNTHTWLLQSDEYVFLKQFIF